MRCHRWCVRRLSPTHIAISEHANQDMLLRHDRQVTYSLLVHQLVSGADQGLWGDGRHVGMHTVFDLHRSGLSFPLSLREWENVWSVISITLPARQYEQFQCHVL